MNNDTLRRTLALTLMPGFLSAALLACDVETQSELDDIDLLERAVTEASRELEGAELSCTQWDGDASDAPCVEWTDVEVQPDAADRLTADPDGQASVPDPGSCAYTTTCWGDPIAPCPLVPGDTLYALYCSDCEDCGAGWQCGELWFKKYLCY